MLMNMHAQSAFQSRYKAYDKFGLLFLLQVTLHMPVLWLDTKSCIEYGKKKTGFFRKSKTESPRKKLSKM